MRIIQRLKILHMFTESHEILIYIYLYTILKIIHVTFDISKKEFTDVTIPCRYKTNAKVPLFIHVPSVKFGL